MKPNKRVLILSALAHALAWAAFLWLAFWPYSYRGISLTEGGAPTETHSSMIEVNGAWVIIPLLAPVVLTAIGLWAIATKTLSKTRRTIYLWAPLTLLWCLCGLAIFSIGFFYLPAALTMLIAAFIHSIKTNIHKPG